MPFVWGWLGTESVWGGGEMQGGVFVGAGTNKRAAMRVMRAARCAGLVHRYGVCGQLQGGLGLGWGGMFVWRRGNGGVGVVMCGWPGSKGKGGGKSERKGRREGEKEHLSWWEGKMRGCRKTTAVEMVKRLSYSNLLGVDEGLKNGRLKEGSLNCDLLAVKHKYPREVLMCRVGEFYESVGFDACMLMEYAGLNPMGGLRAGSSPKAGCPVVNLRHTVDCLTDRGFSVCIMEEVQGPSQARMRKERFVGGHAHPGSPYVYGLLAGGDVDLEFWEPQAVVGISNCVRGYSLVSALEIMRTYTHHQGLTEEAVVAKLRSTRLHKLYLHRSLKEDASGTRRWGEYGDGGLLWAECRGKDYEWYGNGGDAGAAVAELLSKVKEVYDVGEGEEFRRIVPPAGLRPKPLYVGTASQIGVLPTPGVPSLLKVLLAENSNGLCVGYVRDLLLNPPPLKVAHSIQAACKHMAVVHSAIPDFTCVPSAKLVKLIGAKEANKMEFCQIRFMAADVVDMHSKAELAVILEQLLDPVSLATGLHIPHQQLLQDCQYLVRAVSEVIPVEGDPDQVLSQQPSIPPDFFHDLEHKWRGKVRRCLAQDQHSELELAAAALSEAVAQDFEPVLVRTRAVSSAYSNSRAEICYNRENQSVWLKGKRFVPQVWAGTPGEAEIRRLVPALDVKGKKAGEEWFTTQRVEEALDRYRNAAQQYGTTVVHLLQQLSHTLRQKMNAVVFISAFSIIAKALFCHVSEAKRRNWVLPQLVPREDDAQDGSMELVDLVPYWLDSSIHTAVPNRVDMNSMYLLTGPNGGGKSSILRSICAAALLANCGLMVPAQAARVPHFDSIMLRMISHDSPADAKSAFQMEMSELRTVLLEATPLSLVMADELCKGTEVHKGTCIAGSVMEYLDQLGCMGVLSTHLHGLLDLPLNLNHVVHKAMASRLVNNQLTPTWKLVDGVCKESLAFEMARAEGVPHHIIRRAHDLFLQQHHHQQDQHHEPLGTSSFQNPNPLQQVMSEAGANNAFAKACFTKLREITPRPSAQQCHLVGPRQNPPPSTTKNSCVYMLHRPDGKFYVGQTDNIAGRIATHRKGKALKHAPFIYLSVDNKSMACQLETLLIHHLPRLGLALVNKADQNHRHFGAPLAPPPF